jgi:GWxTD domain-containing protein
MNLLLAILFSFYTSKKSEVLVYLIPDDIRDSVQFITFVSFNRQNLIFYKEADYYKSYAELQAEVFDERKNLLFGNSWPMEVVASTFKETKQPKWYQRMFTFKLQRNSQYRLRFRLRDSEGNVIAEFVQAVKAPDLISDPILLDSTALMENSKRPSSSYIRGKKGVFYVKCLVDSIPFKLQIVALKPVYEVKGVLNRGDNFIEVSFKDLKSGSYKVVLLAGKEEREAPLTLFTLPIDFTPTELNQIITILSFLVPQPELDSFNYYKKDPDSLKSYWERFWKRRDPTPETELNEFEEEFWNRVEYADENFSSHLKRGALSDRGICYIVLGPPDEIERHPFELEAPSYEVWYYYYKNYRFVFMDLKGVGDYEIVDPPRYIFYELLKK